MRGGACDVVKFLSSHSLRPDKVQGHAYVVQRPVLGPMYVWLRVLMLLITWAVIDLSVSVGRMKPRFDARICVVSRIPMHKRAGCLHVFAPFALDIDVRRGGALRVHFIREFRGPPVIPMSLMLYVLWCGRLKIYRVRVGWDPRWESVACRGES